MGILAATEADELKDFVVCLHMKALRVPQHVFEEFSHGFGA